MKNETKIIVTIALAGFLAILIYNKIIIYFENKTKDHLDQVKVEFVNFKNQMVIDTNNFQIEGSINDPSLTIDVEFAKILNYKNGKFLIALENQSEAIGNYFKLILISGNISKELSFSYSIKFNEKTKKYLKEIEEKQKIEAQYYEQKIYNNKVKQYGRKAARIKKNHPDWSWEDCQSLADNKIWIGMDVEMLIYKRGRDFHRNVSNYGDGNHYQYCWMDFTPSCFYDKDGDGKIDSYN